uniref:Uncharacterized protein n=1 Tax=Cannabis sativa TaxID=3483 RepID=A0A803QVR8_CANSA
MLLLLLKNWVSRGDRGCCCCCCCCGIDVGGGAELDALPCGCDGKNFCKKLLNLGSCRDASLEVPD